MWNLGRASKGPRNKHLDNSIVCFRLPSPAESSTTIPILRPCNQQARRPGCGSAGPRAEPTPRGMDGTAATTSNRTTNKEPFVRSSEETKRNLRRNWERKKTIERHPSPCCSAIVVRKIASPSNTASGQGPELAGVLQCNGSTSHDSVIGHSPCKGCIQGTEHASSARRRPPASCARCDRLRPACRRRPLPLWCGWLGCRLFWRGFISVFSLVGLVGLVLPRWFWVLLSVVFGLSSRTSCNRRRRRGS